MKRILFLFAVICTFSFINLYAQGTSDAGSLSEAATSTQAEQQVVTSDDEDSAIDEVEIVEEPVTLKSAANLVDELSLARNANIKYLVGSGIRNMGRVYPSERTRKNMNFTTVRFTSPKGVAYCNITNLYIKNAKGEIVTEKFVNPYTNPRVCGTNDGKYLDLKIKTEHQGSMTQYYDVFMQADKTSHVVRTRVSFRGVDKKSGISLNSSVNLPAVLVNYPSNFGSVVLSADHATVPYMKNGKSTSVVQIMWNNKKMTKCELSGSAIGKTKVVPAKGIMLLDLKNKKNPKVVIKCVATWGLSYSTSKSFRTK